jgi:eukaryotic-like serine/threonine-protein kinase
VTGEVPFNADTFNELLFKIVLEAARPVEQVVPGIDPNFAAIVNKSMAREPAARFQNAREFQQALEQWAAGAGPQFAAALNASAQAPGAPRPPMPSVAGANGTGQYPAAPAHTLGTGTPGSWANTGGIPPAQVPQKKSNAGLFVGLGIAAVVVLGGGAFAALSLSHGKDQAAATAEKAEAEKVEAERAKAAEAERAAKELAAKAAAETEKAKAESEALKSEAEKAKAAAAAAEAAAKSAKVVAALPPPRLPTKPLTAKPETKSAPATPPATPATASTGRRIRTSL